MTPKVSVVSITFNQAAFLEDALKGFLMQKTDFPFEILVHDDCSTDGTTEILRQYAEKYPDIIVPLYEEENCYSRHIPILAPMFARARGEYIALCEGDDYWCDPHKLQRQFDYMQKHPDCALVMHNGYTLDIASGVKKTIDPFPEDGILSAYDVIVERHFLPPTASMFFRRWDILEMPELFKNLPAGDRPRRLYLMTKGHIYYMHSLMCVYRTNAPGSFGRTMTASEAKRKEVLQKMTRFYDQYDAYTKQKYHHEIALAKSREAFDFCLRGGDRKNARKTQYFKECMSLKDKLRFAAGSCIPAGLKENLKKRLHR